MLEADRYSRTDLADHLEKDWGKKWVPELLLAQELYRTQVVSVGRTMSYANALTSELIRTYNRTYRPWRHACLTHMVSISPADDFNSLE